MTAKKATAKKATAEKPAAKKEGLRKPLRQVLGVLAKAKEPLNRRAIADKVGATDKLIGGRIAQETLTYAALVEMGFITAKELEADGKTQQAYEITDAGRKALAAT